jgi:hypothetical protein
MKEILADLDRYWFDRINPAGFGLFRILIGFLWLCNLLMLAPEWADWFGRFGYMPPEAGRKWLGGPVPLWGLEIPRLSLLGNVTNDAVGIAFFVVVVIAALTTMLGLGSRISTIVLAVGAVSLHHRNAAILHGGDTVLRICALYLAVGPSGASCSLDRLIRVWRGREGLEPKAVSAWAQRLVCYNVALIYLTTVWIKWQGSLWRDGTATWYTARLEEFHRFPVPAFANDPPLIYVTTYATLLVEFSLATMVFFRPLRKYVLVAGLMLHGYIEYSMNVPLFAFAICSMYVCFFDGDEIGAWAVRMGQRLGKYRAKIRLPSGLTPEGAAFLGTVDPFKLVEYIPDSGEKMRAEDIRSRSLDPYRATWVRSVGAWVFGWIPGLWRRLLNAAQQRA